MIICEGNLSIRLSGLTEVEDKAVDSTGVKVAATKVGANRASGEWAN